MRLELVSSSEAHNAWFRAKVLAALDDSRPDVADDEAQARLAKRRAAAGRQGQLGLVPRGRGAREERMRGLLRAIRSTSTRIILGRSITICHKKSHRPCSNQSGSDACHVYLGDVAAYNTFVGGTRQEGSS